MRKCEKCGHITYDDMSAREMSILQLMSRGLTYAAIGEVLEISDAGVKYHAENIFDKLDVRDRTSAVVKGYETGLIDMPIMLPPETPVVLSPLQPTEPLRILKTPEPEPEEDTYIITTTKKGGKTSYTAVKGIK